MVLFTIDKFGKPGHPTRRKEMPTISGDVWVHVPTGKRFIATEVTSRKYLYSPQLADAFISIL